MPEALVYRCLRCNFSASRKISRSDIEKLICPKCKFYFSALYVAGTECRECKIKEKARRNGERFTAINVLGSFVFDITKARKVAPTDDPLRVSDAELSRCLLTNVTEPRHYAHVPDPDEPGLIASFELPSLTTPLLSLIDGSHRAALKFREGRPFSAYVLPWSVGQKCLLQYAPPGGSLS